ncbi:MAG: hypothetical protein GVY22_10905 [Gammaproteobacteria bacterium]|jgi:hypothetical protein|nr:hypothetical protein [Gammaproteobacteria bacterium]
MTSIAVNTLLALTMAVLISGCVNEPTVLDPPFGESVRQMIAVQTSDPSRNASGLDGVKARNAFDAYRQRTGPLEEVGAVSVGN